MLRAVCALCSLAVSRNTLCCPARVQAALAGMLRAGAAACRDELPGALRVRPRKGSAIVFWHDRAGKGARGDPDGDPRAWHTGCPVLPGGGPEEAVKWTMQKFKETPMRWREHPPRPRRPSS